MDPQQTPQPEVIQPGDPRRFRMPTDYLPSFPTVASALDVHARRIPWWVWLLGGVLVGRGLMSTVTSGIGGMLKRALGWTS